MRVHSGGSGRIRRALSARSVLLLSRGAFSVKPNRRGTIFRRLVFVGGVKLQWGTDRSRVLCGATVPLAPCRAYHEKRIPPDRRVSCRSTRPVPFPQPFFARADKLGASQFHGIFCLYVERQTLWKKLHNSRIPRRYSAERGVFFRGSSRNAKEDNNRRSTNESRLPISTRAK